jgi:hypothetical protein
MNSCFQVCGLSGIHENRFAGFHDFMNTLFLEIRLSGFNEFMIS